LNGRGSEFASRKSMKFRKRKKLIEEKGYKGKRTPTQERSRKKTPSIEDLIRRKKKSSERNSPSGKCDDKVKKNHLTEGGQKKKPQKKSVNQKGKKGMREKN